MPAGARRGALSIRRQIDVGENLVERLLRPLGLLGVEVGRHIFHERRRHHRLNVDQPQLAAAQPSPAPAPAGVPSARGRLGEVDRENDPLVHEASLHSDRARDRKPVLAELLKRALPVWQVACGKMRHRSAAFLGLRRRPAPNDSHCSFIVGSL